MDEIEKDQTMPKILVADDDPCARNAVAERCKRMGFEVETAANGLQTLIKAGEWRPDSLIIDVHMPEVDGLSVLSYMRDAAKGVSDVIVVTGSRGQDIAAKCEALGVSCIRKGPHFWDEFESRLIALYPQWDFAIRDSGRLQAAAVPQAREAGSGPALRRRRCARLLARAARGAERHRLRLPHAPWRCGTSPDPLAARAGDSAHSGHHTDRAAAERRDQAQATAGNWRAARRDAHPAKVRRHKRVDRSAAARLRLYQRSRRRTCPVGERPSPAGTGSPSRRIGIPLSGSRSTMTV